MPQATSARKTKEKEIPLTPVHFQVPADADTCLGADCEKESTGKTCDGCRLNATDDDDGQ